jgi:hypothetical protein
MWQRCGHVIASICAASVGLLLSAAPPATAASHVASANYAVVGGSTRESAQIEAALAASSFDWRVLPSIQVHVEPGVPARSTPGHVWLSSELLSSGRFGWAVIQDEFAHQVDFFLLDDDEREILNAALGGDSWYAGASVPHSRRGVERFTSTFVWAYWPARENSYRPRSKGDESAALRPTSFRSLLELLLATN